MERISSIDLHTHVDTGTHTNPHYTHKLRKHTHKHTHTHIPPSICSRMNYYYKVKYSLTLVRLYMEYSFINGMNLRSRVSSSEIQ